MEFQATAIAFEPAAEPQPRNLDFYRVRDDIVRAYQPATEEERILTTQIAQTWFRLQRLYAAETDILEQRSLPDLFDSDTDRFKTMHRAIAEAERMWRNAVEMFRQARRRREHPSRFEAPRHAGPVTVTSLRPTPAPYAIDEPMPPAAQPDPVSSSAPATCSRTPTPRAPAVEKYNNRSVVKSKGSLN